MNLLFRTLCGGSVVLQGNLPQVNTLAHDSVYAVHTGANHLPDENYSVNSMPASAYRWPMHSVGLAHCRLRKVFAENFSAFFTELFIFSLQQDYICLLITN